MGLKVREVLVRKHNIPMSVRLRRGVQFGPKGVKRTYKYVGSKSSGPSAKRGRFSSGFRRSFGDRRSVGNQLLWSSSSAKYVGLPGVGIPLQIRTRLPFFQNWVEAAAAGFISYVWKANSTWDPDPTVGGSRPTGVTQWTSLYSKYCVLGSSVSIHVVNHDADDPLYVTVCPVRGTGNLLGTANSDSIPGLPGAKTICVSNAEGGDTVSSYAKIRDIVGVKYCDDTYLQGDLNTNDPTRLCYWSVYMWNTSGNALNATASIRIIYDTVLSGPRNEAALA